MSKITPGSWTVENRMTCGEGWAVSSDHDFPNSNGTTHRQYVAQIVGNPETARAISAVPEMMEALEPFARFAAALESFGKPSPQSGDYIVLRTKDGPVSVTVEQFRAARAALAKARGETP